jgi:Gly-Xaa carboxypeptidase
VTAIVNHRINIASTYTEVQKHVIDTVLPVAKAYNLQVEAFGEKVYEGSLCPMHLNDPKAGKIILSEAFNSS